MAESDTRISDLIDLLQEAVDDLIADADSIDRYRELIQLMVDAIDHALTEDNSESTILLSDAIEEARLSGFTARKIEGEAADATGEEE